MEIKDASPLVSDWECPRVINRGDEVKMLYTHILSPLIDKQRVPLTVGVYGNSGSGKTFTITKTIKEDVSFIKDKIKNFEYIYINLKDQGVPSYYTVLLLIANKLKKYLPVNIPELNNGLVEQISMKGLDRQYMLTVVKGIVRARQLCVLLVIDEVDRVFDYEGKDDFFYAFSGMYKQFESDKIGISTIFVSNSIHLFNKLSKPTRDRIPFFIHFKPYSVDDLYQILKFTVGYVVDGEISDSVLIRVAKDVGNSNKSAREAKLLLYNVLTGKSFDNARIETDKDILRNEIAHLSFDQLVVLSSVLFRSEQIKKMLMSANPGRYKQLTEPTAGSVYDIYCKLVKKYNHQPKTYMTFKRLSDSLEKDALIKTDLKSLGRARGITTLMTPGCEKEVLVSLIKEFLPEKIM